MAKRTVVNKILFKHNCCIVIIFLFQYLTISKADEAPTTAANATAPADSNSTFIHPVAEALVRYRRQPPRTIVKHIIRPKRVKVKRIKRPKIKYSFAEPPPAIYFKSSSKPPHPSKQYSSHGHTFDSSMFEDYSHLNVESPDFNLPPSSYETLSMDLDFYKGGYESSGETIYKETEKHPSYSYAAPEEHVEIPKYSYAAPPASRPKEHRKPHTKYGVPTEFIYSSGYDKPSYSYIPASYESSKVVEKPSLSYSKEEYSYSQPAEQPPPRIPATKYGVPDINLPTPNFEDYNKYTLIEQNPHSSYESFESIKTNKHNFAEPPAHEPNVEVMYSPSYEIKLSPTQEQYHPGYKSQPPPEPPQQYEPQPNYHQPNTYQESSDTHQPASYEPAPAQDLPITQNHRHPTYDFPKSSYEVPIYDPIPFDSSSNDQHEVYPPQPFDNNSWKQVSHTDYEGEPNNISEQKPPQQQMNTHSDSDETHAEDTHSSGTRQQGQSANIGMPSKRPRRTRKRNRTKATTISTTKHILDVPELQQAFENEKRNQFQNAEPEGLESHKVVNINSGLWNPMRIRTPSLGVTTPATTFPINQYSSNGRNPYHYKQRTTTTTTELPPRPLQPQQHQQQTNHIPNVEIISIEKSRSKTYYDGILSTPKIYNTNFYRNRFRTEQQRPPTPTSSTQPNTASKERFSKRTTKNVFDTTVFKSPLTDRDVYRNLPKNHKLF